MSALTPLRMDSYEDLRDLVKEKVNPAAFSEEKIERIETLRLDSKKVNQTPFDAKHEIPHATTPIALGNHPETAPIVTVSSKAAQVGTTAINANAADAGVYDHTMEYSHSSKRQCVIL